MRVVIAGGHGKIALLLERLLAARGETAVGLVRDPAHAADLRAAGATPVLVDLEAVDAATLARDLGGADAVVFAAGAGPGSTAERKDTVDRAGSVLLADAAELADVRRFVQISGIGANREPAPGVGEVFAAYLRAKRAAEGDLRGRDRLDWTILRPGGLTDDPPTGTVRLAPAVGSGTVSRADVAAVLLALLDEPATAGQTLELVTGDVAVERAVRSVATG
jgi:uncharacterized protein YbjT (DUF2867 family)